MDRPAPDEEPTPGAAAFAWLLEELPEIMGTATVAEDETDEPTD